MRAHIIILGCCDLRGDVPQEKKIIPATLVDDHAPVQQSDSGSNGNISDRMAKEGHSEVTSEEVDVEQSVARSENPEMNGSNSTPVQAGSTAHVHGRGFQAQEGQIEGYSNATIDEDVIDEDVMDEDVMDEDNRHSPRIDEDDRPDPLIMDSIQSSTESFDPLDSDAMLTQLEMELAEDLGNAEYRKLPRRNLTWREQVTHNMVCTRNLHALSGYQTALRSVKRLQEPSKVVYAKPCRQWS